MKINSFLLFVAAIIALTSCNRVDQNCEGVLQSNYGQNGIEDLTVVTGAQGPLGPGSILYEIPMWQHRAATRNIKLISADGGVFWADPTYTFMAMRGKGPEIVYHYKNLGLRESLDSVAASILDPVVLNAFNEESAKYSTDSLIFNRLQFERQVQDRLDTSFISRYFTLKDLTSGLQPDSSVQYAIELRNRINIEAGQVAAQLQVEINRLENAKTITQTMLKESEGLTPQVLKARFIEALRNTPNKVIIVTDGNANLLINQND
jgi:hypothetical protein